MDRRPLIVRDPKTILGADGVIRRGAPSAMSWEHHAYELEHFYDALVNERGVTVWE